MYLVSIVELVIHESGDDACLANRLIAKEDELILCKGRDCGGSRFGHGTELARSGIKYQRSEIRNQKSETETC